MVVLLLFVTCNDGCANTVFILPDNPVIAIPDKMERRETEALQILITNIKNTVDNSRNKLSQIYIYWRVEIKLIIKLSF